ncbi:flagellar biosynthesis protein FlgG [Anaerobacillus alkalilacustris]|uniref:Flagellar biosynthesis protein FlgG n=1 Tax=Anaerobacillus alkalilacustris TaxID=393763 RepID=A0A1S2LGP2_9BACI|nr:flagellar hook-basal body protein [Anaerobacillus alkalilacustris]OIJ11719.1 flagellar biosynthesis protein FlgG [Anaerobacillus alkalilacustris]
MNQSMITASVTMGQLQKKLDTISHNVANVNTNGYKRRDVQFQDLLFQQLNNQTVHQQETGRNTSNGLRIGSGARVSQTILRMEQGAINQTGRPLDIAIGEKGIFFEVLPTDENEPRRFTRDGAFYLTPNPNNADELFLVTGDGDFVMSATGNAIAIPANYDSINVTETGTILVTLKGELDTEINLGQLQLFRVTKPQLLESIGDNYFSFPDLEQLGLGFDDVLELVPENEGKLIQGALEGSNVDLGKELSELILAQRAYQFNTRSISMADQMMGLVNNIRG